MAIVVATNDPAGLLKAIYKAIDDEKIATWTYDSDGDFTHSPDQWRHKAWLRPKVSDTELRLGILKQKDVDLSTVVYAVYHGRFIEMLLSHFDDQFRMVYSTAKKADPDRF